MARDLDDAVAESRACKLLTFFDRLILATPRRRGTKHGGLSPLITSRLRLAWKGDWGALWRDAAAAGGHAAQPGGRARTLREEARAVNTLVREGLVSKALSLVRSTGALVGGSAVYTALLALFPAGAVPAPPPQQPAPLTPETRADLVAAARRQLSRYPARSGPGPNGSRFEHWATTLADSEAADQAAELAVRFLLGECPADFLRATWGHG